MRGVSLTRVDLRRADLTGAKIFGPFESAFGDDAADASGACLDGVVAMEVDLSSLRLEAASFRRTKLLRVKLNGVRLGPADFSGSNLEGSQLRLADLTGATLEDTILHDVDLTP